MSPLSTNISSISEARIIQGITLQFEHDSLCLHAEHENAVIECNPLLMGLKENWAPEYRLKFFLSAPEGPIILSIELIGENGFLGKEFLVEATSPKAFDMPLQRLPIILQPKAQVIPHGILFRFLKEGKLNLHMIELGESGESRFPCIDKSGTVIDGQNSTTILSDSLLKKDIKKEIKFLKKMKPSIKRSPFNGWKNDLVFQGNGFFKLGRNQQGRWWLIDPTGYLFWLLGIANVDPNQVYNESLLIPEAEGYSRSPNFEENQSVNFINNLIDKKYGTLKNWQKHLTCRFNLWGINTMGIDNNDVDRSSLKIAFYAKIHSFDQDEQGFPDPFDPIWLEDLEKKCHKIYTDFAKNPYFLGYHIDPHIQWSKLFIMNAAPGSYLKEAWIDWLKGRYENIQNFNTAWDKAFQDWEQLKEITEADIPRERETPSKDRTEFFKVYLETYFKRISHFLNNLDDTHFYFGASIPQNESHRPTIETANQYCDLICLSPSTNLEKELPLSEIETMSQNRPILLVNQATSIPIHPEIGTNAEHPSPNARALAWETHLKESAKHPSVIGIIWDDLYDPPPTGNLATYSNQRTGFLNIHDQPDEALVCATANALSDIYKNHLNSLPSPHHS